MIVGISGKISSGKDTVAKIIQYLTWYKDVKEEFKEMNDISFVLHWLQSDIQVHEDNLNWKIKKFAGKLKQIASIFTGIPMEDFEKQEVKDSELPDEWSTYKFKAGNGEYFHFGTKSDIPTHDKHGYNVEPMTVRRFLQKLGTDAVRNRLHPDAWVNALFADYKSLVVGKDGFITTDLGDTIVRWKDHPIFEPSHYPNWIITDVRFPNEANAIKQHGGILLRIHRPESDAKAGAHVSETALDDYQGFDFQIENDGSIGGLIEKVKIFLDEFKLIQII